MPTKRYRLVTWNGQRMPNHYSLDSNNFSYLCPSSTSVNGHFQYFGDPGAWNITGEVNASTAESMEDSDSSLRFRIIDDYGRIGGIKTNYFRNDQASSTSYWKYHQCAHTHEYENTTPRGDGTGVAWEMDTYNRCAIFVRPPETYGEIGDDRKEQFWRSYRDDHCNIGTYLTPMSCVHQPEGGWGAHDHSAQKEVTWRDAGDADHPEGRPQRGHGYHHFSHLVGGVWNQIIVDMAPGYSYDSTYPSRQIPYTPHPYYASRDLSGGEEDTSHNYFDCLLYFYFHTNQACRHAPIPVGRGNEWHMGSNIFYEDPHQNDEDCTFYIRGLVGSWHPGRGEIAIGYDTGRMSAYKTDIRWSFSDMHAATNPGTSSGFDTAGIAFTTHHSGLSANWPYAVSQMGFPPDAKNLPVDPLEQPTVFYTTNSSRPYRRFWSDEISPGGNDGVYIAVRPVQGDLPAEERNTEVFRQIYIPFTDGNLPLHLKD